MQPARVKRQFRDPYGDWWDKQERRNYNEPVHEDYDQLGMFTPYEYTWTTPGKGLAQIGAFIATFLSVCYIVKLTYPDRVTVPREFEDGLEKELGGPGAVRVSFFSCFPLFLFYLRSGSGPGAEWRTEEQIANFDRHGLLRIWRRNKTRHKGWKYGIRRTTDQRIGTDEPDRVHWHSRPTVVHTCHRYRRKRIFLKKKKKKKKKKLTHLRPWWHFVMRDVV